MLFYSRPVPQAAWWQATVVVFGALFATALVGYVIVMLTGAPLAGPPKDGSAMSWRSVLTLIGAAGLAAPVLGAIAVPLAIPLARTAMRRGWAGVGTAVTTATILGLPVVHFGLNGDLTTEAPWMILIIAPVLAAQGLCGWLIWQVLHRRTGAEVT